MTNQTQDGQAQVFVILNPVAGTTDVEQVRQYLDEAAAAAGSSYEVLETTGDEDLRAVVRDALKRGFRVIAAGGGDGTVSAVANGLSGSEAALCILPMGTANVLSQELGVPADMQAACALLFDNEAAAVVIDGMEIGGRVAVLHIGVGLGAELHRDTPREAKRRFGRLAYIWVALTRLVGYEPHRFTLVIDGRELRVRASHVVVANGGTLGMAPFRWGPGIRADDGVVDVGVFSARAWQDYLSLAWSTLRGKQRQNQRARYFKANKSVTIKSDRKMPVQADGEIVGDTPATITVVPHTVRIRVPLEVRSEK